MVLATLLDLLAPVDCAGCGAEREHVCPTCRRLLGRPPRRVAPDPTPDGFPPTCAGPAYEEEVRRILLAWKEHGRAPVQRILAPVLADAIDAVVDGSQPRPIVLVPIPTSQRSVRARAGDPLLDLARSAARELQQRGTPATVQRALRLVREVHDQAGLSSAERAANLDHAYAVQPWAPARLRRSAVVVVDDIVTTGATLTEAARALRSGGVVVRAACLAAVDRQGRKD